MKLKAKIQSKIVPAQLKFLYQQYDIIANAILGLPSSEKELQAILMQVEEGHYAHGEFLKALRQKLEGMEQM